MPSNLASAVLESVAINRPQEESQLFKYLSYFTRTTSTNAVVSVIPTPDPITVQAPLLSISNAKLYRMAVDAQYDLRNYLTFSKGWDGYDGELFDRNLIRFAQAIIADIAKFFDKRGSLPSGIFPGPASDGSIDIEVTFKAKRLIFTIYPRESQIAVFSQEGSKTYQGNVSIDEMGLEVRLSWLVS